jgi:hypothetical protein
MTDNGDKANCATQSETVALEREADVVQTSPTGEIDPKQKYALDPRSPGIVGGGWVYLI